MTDLLARLPSLTLSLLFLCTLAWEVLWICIKHQHSIHHPYSSTMKIILLLIYITSHSTRPASAQSSFSPFSLLGSLFSSAPSWPRPRQVRQRKPQLPQQQQIFFRPNVPTGQKFSASQVVVCNTFSKFYPDFYLSNHSIIHSFIYLFPIEWGNIAIFKVLYKYPICIN